MATTRQLSKERKKQEQYLAENTSNGKIISSTIPSYAQWLEKQEPPVKRIKVRKPKVFKTVATKNTRAGLRGNVDESMIRRLEDE